jgi:hypothetical protein
MVSHSAYSAALIGVAAVVLAPAIAGQRLYEEAAEDAAALERSC